MPAVRKPSVHPNRWQLSGWVLGSPEFIQQAHAVLRSGFEKVARRPSAWRESNGEVGPVQALQPSDFLLFEGVGIEISRATTEGEWGGKQLRALEESLKAMPGWGQGFAVVLAAWVGFPLYANSVEASPRGHIFTPEVEYPSCFRTSDLNFGDALRETIQAQAIESVKTQAGQDFTGSADELAHAALLAKVTDYARRSPIWSLARERALAASLPTVSARSGYKPRF